MRVAVLSLLALFSAIPASAQRSRPWAERGDIALVGVVSGVSLGDIRPVFDGIGARYRVRDRTVVGASVGFSYADRTADGTGDRSGAFESDDTSGGLRIAVWNENHVGRRGAPVSPFVGVGVQVRTRHATNERTLSCPPVEACEDSVERIEQDAVAVGLGALLGAEVRIARGVTLGAAYTLGAEVSRETVEFRSESDRSRDDRFTAFQAGTSLTALHLSVYF